MPKRSSKKPRDVNELAKAVVDEVTGEIPSTIAPLPLQPDDSGKNPAAVELGRLGGLRGGKARAKKLTKRQRVESARKAALARWRKHQKSDT